MIEDRTLNVGQEKPQRFMYHSFPRRRSAEIVDRKGLVMLELIAQHGLLLTPEVQRWRDDKLPPSPSEEYIQVSRCCCFTELSENELAKHSEYFGPYSLEFEHRVLIDLGAMPVFYIPRMSEYKDYGVGPAIVTQLAHIQELLSRVTALKEFARVAVDASPSLPIFAKVAADGGLVLQVTGTTLSCTIPRGIVERARIARPDFQLPDIPAEGAPLGFNSGGFLNFFNFLTWGLHEPDILTGTVKALASIIYSTERHQDPLLSHYQQRKWRIIGGLLRENTPLTEKPSVEHRKRLLELDPDFFGRKLDLPSGPTLLVDACEVFSKKHTGESVFSLVRRLICPADHVQDVSALLRDFPAVEVVPLDELSPSQGKRSSR